MNPRILFAMASVVAVFCVNAGERDAALSDVINYEGITALELDVGSLDVSIRTSHDDQVSWKLVGRTGGISPRIENNKLYLSKTESSFPSFSVTMNGNAGNVSLVQLNGVFNHSVTTTFGSCSRDCKSPTLELRLPESVSIHFNDYKGKATLESTTAHLEFSGSGVLEVGSLGDAGLRLSGNAEVSAAKVSGSVWANLSGNSFLYIHTGYIPMADFTLQGNSNIQFDGDIERLYVNSSGNSKALISHVVEISQQSTRGNAEVCVSSSNGFWKSCS
jgi:hypothetical protein